MENEWVKKKNEKFFFAKATHKYKLVKFSWRIFVVLQPQSVEVFKRISYFWDFVMRLYLLFEIYCCIFQFIVKCKLKFGINLIVVISIYLRSGLIGVAPWFFPVPKGFSCKIWCSCVVIYVSIMLVEFFLSIT